MNNKLNEIRNKIQNLKEQEVVSKAMLRNAESQLKPLREKLIQNMDSIKSIEPNLHDILVKYLDNPTEELELQLLNIVDNIVASIEGDLN